MNKILLLFTTISLSAKDIMLSWNPVENATGYKITYGANIQVTKYISSTNLIVDVSDNRTYTFIIESYDDIGTKSIPTIIEYKNNKYTKSLVLDSPKVFIKKIQ